MAIKEDCAFLLVPENGSRRSCIALKEMICIKRECPFYKNFETAKRDIEKYGYRRKVR